jgi:hypothetical protein
VKSPDLNFSEGSVDLIFSNWLLMYLSDKEVNRLDPYSCLSCLIVVLLTDLLVIHLKASWNQWSVLWWSYWSLPQTFDESLVWLWLLLHQSLSEMLINIMCFFPGLLFSRCLQLFVLKQLWEMLPNLLLQDVAILGP